MSKFTPLLILVLVGLFFAMAPSVWAQGGPGSLVCGQAQQACQAAIAPPAVFKNHGKEVSACAKASNPEAGFDITDECHSCIVNQVARGIPLDEQEFCGQVTACDPGEVCDGFIPGCNADFPDGCACFSTSPTGFPFPPSSPGECVDDFLCNSAEDCGGPFGPCPDGKTCYFDTCCSNGVVGSCGPQDCTGVIQGLPVDAFDSLNLSPLVPGGTAGGNIR